MQVHLTLKSGNKKTGPIPVSTTTYASCPDACPFRAKGCYAAGGPLAIHWRKVTRGEAGTAWAEFAAAVAALPEGQLWRHNQAGDLPGVADRIDTAMLEQLVAANAGRRGFTYTHKPVHGDHEHAASNRAAVASANAEGFTVNLSADTLAEADELSDLGIGPVVVVLDAVEGERHRVHTPAGRLVETCPATYKDTSCAECRLCAVGDRKVIVGFPAHGSGKKAAAAVARG